MNLRMSAGLAATIVGALLAVQSCSDSCPNCPGSPARLVISPDSSSVLPGDTIFLGVEVLDADGHLLAGHVKDVQWQSLNGFATVNDSGRVAAVSQGVDSIVATLGGLVDTSRIRVVTNPTFAAHIYPILTPTCGIGGCHVTPGPPPTLNAATAAAFTQLTTVANNYLTAGDTTVGKLLFRLRGDTTAKMPPQEQLSTLDPAAYHLIAVWIAQGAAP